MRSPMAMSAASVLVTGLAEKRCFNLYQEPNPNDPSRPFVLMEAPGSLQRNDYGAAIRGMWQADGHASSNILVAHGTTLATYVPSSDTASTLAGTIPGSDRGDAAFTETEALFLFDGKPCYSDGTTIRRATDGVLDDPVLAIGSTPANVATGAFDYSINGTTYSKTAVAAGTAPGNDVIPLGLYGAVALDIDTAGTITAVEATGNATGYASAALARAGVPAVAVAHIRIGYVTATKSDGAFTFGTTALNAANTTVAYTDSDVNTGFTDLLTDHEQSGFTSVATLGQRGILTYGSRFCYTDVLAMNSTNALSYYTAESSSDALVAARVVGEVLYLFGTKTIEAWSQTGDADDPFSLQPGMTQQVGCACRDGIVRADNTLLFVDEAYNVRRLGSGASSIVSEPWVADLLAGAGSADIIGFTYQDRGHIFCGWRTSDGCVVYDSLTQLWHTRGTLNSDTWRYTDMVTAADRVFVADATGQFDELSRDYTSESMANVSTMGTEMQREFTSFLPSQSGRMAIKTVKLECAKGVGISTGQGSDPVVEMRQSKDGGNTWTSWRSRKIGAQGVYDKRTIWRRRGRAKDQGIVFHFRKSDPVRTAFLGVIVNEDHLG